MNSYKDQGDDNTCTAAIDGTGNSSKPCKTINYTVWGNVGQIVPIVTRPSTTCTSMWY